MVGAGDDFLCAGCGRHRIESIAGLDHHLFATRKHRKQQFPSAGLSEIQIPMCTQTYHVSIS